MTVRLVLKVLKPPPADITAEPIISPILILVISKLPELDVNKEESISTSPAS